MPNAFQSSSQLKYMQLKRAQKPKELIKVHVLHNEQAENVIQSGTTKGSFFFNF